MKKLLPYITLVLLLVFMLFLYGFSAKKNNSRIVKETEVEFVAGANNFLTHSLVDEMLIQNGKNVKNQEKRIVDLHVLETKVKASAYVEKATVFMGVNGVLKTKIKQRDPLARIVNKKENFYIDSYGVKIPLSKGFSARVPLVSGEVITEKEAFKDIVVFAKLLQEDAFLAEEIIAIKFTKNKEYILTARSGDYKIFFGKFINVFYKIKKLKAFYNKAFLDKTIHKYSVINLKYHKQVVCTKQS